MSICDAIFFLRETGLGTGTKSSRDAIYFLVTLVVGKNAEPLLGKAGLVLKRISLHGTFGQNFQEQIADETTTSSSFFSFQQEG